MRVLVTNDDGIDSEGVRSLALAVRAAGLDVVVAAPLREFSGSSAGLSAIEEDGRVIIEPRALDGLAGAPVYGVAASPAFIVLLAMRSAFGPPPDVVVSGVNIGANTGQAVLHSGTVGAALTAASNGCRAMAVSLDVGLVQPDVLHWDTARAVAGALLPLALHNPSAAVLNVNVPNRPLHELAGTRRARLGAVGAVQMTMLEQGEGYVRMSLEDTGETPEPGTDEALLLEGYVAVTPLRPSWEAADVALAGLELVWQAT